MPTSTAASSPSFGDEELLENSVLLDVVSHAHLAAAVSEIDPLFVFDFEVGSVESRKMIYSLCTLPLL